MQRRLTTKWNNREQNAGNETSSGGNENSSMTPTTDDDQSTMSTDTPTDGNQSTMSTGMENGARNSSTQDEYSNDQNGINQPTVPVFVNDKQYKRVQGFLGNDNGFPKSERFALFRKDEKVFMLSGYAMMRKVVGEFRWKENCEKHRLCEWTHVSDEAFLVLLIENNETLWTHLAQEQ